MADKANEHASMLVAITNTMRHDSDQAGYDTKPLGACRPASLKKSTNPAIITIRMLKKMAAIAHTGVGMGDSKVRFHIINLLEKDF